MEVRLGRSTLSQIAVVGPAPTSLGSSPPLLSAANTNSDQPISLSAPLPSPSRANIGAGASLEPLSSSLEVVGAAGEGEGEAGELSEQLRVSVSVTGELQDRHTPTSSQHLYEEPSASPIRVEVVSERRRGVQTTLTGSLFPPPPQQLPNLAREALRRLAEREGEGNGDDSIEDFRPLKKRRLCQETENDGEDEDEGQTCSICFEPWSNSGSHRIASLKCGHLFGLNCIEKWIKGKGGGKCPQCNAKTKRTDIRVIFAKSIRVLDTTERDRAIQEREEEKVQRIAAQKAEAQAVLQCQLARAECDRLKEQLRLIRQELEEFKTRGVQSGDCASSSSATTTAPNSTIAQSSSDSTARYAIHKTISVSATGGARVLAHDSSLGVLVASKPSTNHLLPGCGLMKYSTFDLTRGEFVSAHSGVIRDAVFSPSGDGLVLTASMDKTCRLTSMHSNTNVLTYKTPSPVWACAWNEDDPNYVYAGLNGSICVYDIRNTAGCVSSLQREGDRAPVTSLSYVPLCGASTFSASGLLAGSLNGGVFWQRDTHQQTFTPHPLSTIPGNCTGLSFEPTTRHCMASFRPSMRLQATPRSTHVLCQLCNIPHDQPLSCRPIHQFVGGTSNRLLSRSRLFQRPGQDCSTILAAFGVEEHNSVSVWNASTMTRLQTLSLPQGPALDIAPFSCGERDFLAVLSETTLSLFHWQLLTQPS